MAKSLGVLKTLAKALFLPFYLILGTLEEIALFFKPQAGVKTLLGVNINDITEAFDSLVEGPLKEIREVFKEISAFAKEKTGLDFKPTLGLKDTLKMAMPGAAAFSQVASGGSPYTVVVENKLFLDGDVAAESITKTPAFNTAVDRNIDIRGR